MPASSKNDPEPQPEPSREQRSFAETFDDLRRKRGNPTLSKLARDTGVSTSHLSRALRGADKKSFSPRLISAIGVALGVPADYFPETRQEFVFERIRRDPALRERLYDELR